METLINKLNIISISNPNIKDDIDILCDTLEKINIEESLENENYDKIITQISCDLSNVKIINTPEVLQCIKDYFTFLYKKTKCFNNIFEHNSCSYIF
jgi:hypothetical protein